jgi:Ca-activated chloride channel family protein
MFRFANSFILYFLILIPIFSVLFSLLQHRKQKSIERFGDLNLMQQLMPDASKSRPFWKFVLLMAALTFVILGLARPQFGSKLQEVKRKGVEIIIALDVSNSMNARDIQPSRLEHAKQIITKLVDRLDNDKIGLIIFAGESYMQMPITTDYVSAKMFLSDINTNIVAVQGTAIGSAINMALKSFSLNSNLQKVLLIITDGENHEDDPIEAAKAAYEKGVIIYTMGIGLPEGAPIPAEGRQADYKKDQGGTVVISKLDEVTLEKIALNAGGIYIRANNTMGSLNTLFSKLNNLTKKEYESKIYSDYDDQFQYFFGFVFIILIIEYFVVERKGKWFRNIKLFEIRR